MGKDKAQAGKVEVSRKDAKAIPERLPAFPSLRVFPSRLATLRELFSRQLPTFRISPYDCGMTIYDVSVAISPSTPTYPGDPGIEFQQWAAIEKGDPANVTMLHFGAHTATHVDAPAHFIEGKSRVDSMPLEVLMGPARVVEIPADASEIGPAHIERALLNGATRVLFKTRNSEFWADKTGLFRPDFTSLSPPAAQRLVDLGVRLVGIDYLSVEKYNSVGFETHTILLERGVVIVEGLDLRGVVDDEYELICLPLKLAAGTGDGAPARAVLRSLGEGDKTA